MFVGRKNLQKHLNSERIWLETLDHRTHPSIWKNVLTVHCYLHSLRTIWKHTNILITNISTSGSCKGDISSCSNCTNSSISNKDIIIRKQRIVCELHIYTLRVISCRKSIFLISYSNFFSKNVRYYLIYHENALLVIFFLCIFYIFML